MLKNGSVVECAFRAKLFGRVISGDKQDWGYVYLVQWDSGEEEYVNEDELILID